LTLFGFQVFQGEYVRKTPHACNYSQTNIDPVRKAVLPLGRLSQEKSQLEVKMPKIWQPRWHWSLRIRADECRKLNQD